MVAPSISLFKVNITLNFKPWIFYSTSFEWLFSSFLVCTVACLASNNHDTLKHWEKTKELVTGSTHVPILDITLRKFFLLLQYEVVAVWPDWAIDWTFDNFLKPLAAINLPNLPHSFVKVSKSNIFLVKSFLSNFYRHLVIFWSHWVVGTHFGLAIRHEVSKQDCQNLLSPHRTTHTMQTRVQTLEN